MWLILGFLIVVASVLGAFMMGGGKPYVLLHLSEFVCIGGIAVGILIVSSPSGLLSRIFRKVRDSFTGKTAGTEEYMEMLKTLYELFVLGRRSGLIALEDHMLDPQNSSIFQKYPRFLADRDKVEFLCNGLKPLISGRIKPEQLEGLLQAELDAKEEENDGPVHILQLVGDSLPGIGIIAAVLGIINTMAAISDGPTKVGQRVAAALTGTFLGVLGAYGFVNPLANRIKMSNMNEMQSFVAMQKGVVSFVNGMPPLMAVEVARRSLDTRLLPDSDEMEMLLKGLNSQIGR